MVAKHGLVEQSMNVQLVRHGERQVLLDEENAHAAGDREMWVYVDPEGGTGSFPNASMRSWHEHGCFSADLSSSSTSRRRNTWRLATDSKPRSGIHPLLQHEIAVFAFSAAIQAFARPTAVQGMIYHDLVHA